MKKKIVLFSVLAVFAVIAVIAVPSALAHIPPSKTYPANAVWFDPEASSAEYCETVDVDVWIQTDVPSIGFHGLFDYTFCCANVTEFVGNETNWDLWCDAELTPGHVKIDASILESNPANIPVHIGTLTIHCCNETSSCQTDLVWNTEESYIEDLDGNDIEPVNWVDGTFSCESEGPSTKVDIRADGIAGNIFDVTGYSICPGTVTEDGVTIGNETAMGALVIYCQNSGINVQITIGTLGEYVVQIGNDPADNNSWSYAVNEEVPPVGGAQKVIVDGNRVHWYNYNLNYYSVLTAIDKTEIVVGETLTATVTWKSITGIHLLNGASVHVGTMGPWGPEPGPSVGTTGVDGTCTFPWSTVGTWGVYAVDSVHGSGIYNYPPVSFTCSTEGKPDLNVTEITLNCGYLFASESNEICAKIENIGGGGAGAFNVRFDN
jgi:hypothetical protein